MLELQLYNYMEHIYIYIYCVSNSSPQMLKFFQ